MGSVVSPALFNVFTTDLIEDLELLGYDAKVGAFLSLCHFIFSFNSSCWFAVIVTCLWALFGYKPTESQCPDECSDRT